MISRFKLSVTTVGVAGSATASATTSAPINGRLLAVHCDFGATAHANTDTTIATTSSPTTTILTLTDTNTDGWYYPKHAIHGSTGTALVLNSDDDPMVDDYYLDDYIKVTLAESTAVASVFTFLVEV